MLIHQAPLFEKLNGKRASNRRNKHPVYSQDVFNSHIHHIREIATAGIKSKGHAERAILFVFCGGPALTIYPARAVGCSTGKYGMVCLLDCWQECPALYKNLVILSHSSVLNYTYG